MCTTLIQHILCIACYLMASAGKNFQNFLSPGCPVPNGPYSGSISVLALHQQIKVSEQDFRSGPIIPALSLALFLRNLSSLLTCCESQVSISPLPYSQFSSLPSCKDSLLVPHPNSTVHFQTQVIPSSASGVPLIPDATAVCSSLILPGDLTHHFCDCSFASKPHLMLGLSS